MISEWDEYIAARNSGLKVKWKPLLAERLLHLAKLDEKEKPIYLERLCHQYFELKITEIPIQHPEIWDAILIIWKSRLNWNDEQLLLWIVKAIHFKGTYLLLDKNSSDILRRILELNPRHSEAKILLFEEHLNTLDFSMHSMDAGMLIDRSAGEKIIAECENLLAGEPALEKCKTRFGYDFLYYKTRFISWYEYSIIETNLSFDDWYDEKYNQALE